VTTLAELALPIVPAAAYPPVVAAFRAWADRAPEHPAVQHGSQSWTYRALAARADAIAAVLQQRSPVATDAVAVIGRPGPALIASLLGVLTSGRVLVPIDPEIPAARRAIMRREAGVTDVIVVGDAGDEGTLRVDPRTGALAAAVPPTAAAAAAVPPPAAAVPPTAAAVPPTAAAVPPTAGDLAAGDDAGPGYVFYTSGSTGEPKGILGTRRGVAHFLAWQRAVIGVAPSDRFSQLTGISFDVMLREILLPLTSGATLVIPDADALHAPLGWLRDAGITVVHTVPSRAEHWLRRAGAARLPRLRAVFFAGEPLTSSLVRRWRLLAPDSDVINLYGPTETTLAKCFFRVPDDVEAGTQPIGRPLPDTQVLVLDADGAPLAPGQAGELALRTPFRTLGYLNAADEQRAKFVVNPLRADPADLIYRTGDRGLVRADGVVEIHGRMDRQIKIRGARVELGEIEALLRRHPDVEQAVVAVTDGDVERAVDRVIVAFVVVGRRPAGLDLRAYLAGHLPAWMVPTAILEVDEMPLNRNGKTDKPALLARYAERSVRRRPAERAPTPLEALVIDHAQAVLGIGGVRRQDDFFRLGGDSRAAVRLAARLRAALHVAVPLPLLFDTPVIADLARALEDAGASAGDDHALLHRLGGPSDSRDTERTEL
jgi:amino acid adenylation domain-containing protein